MIDKFLELICDLAYRFRREILAFTPLFLAVLIRSSSGPLSGEAAVLWMLIIVLYMAGILSLARRFPGLGLFGICLLYTSRCV